MFSVCIRFSLITCDVVFFPPLGKPVSWQDGSPVIYSNLKFAKIEGDKCAVMHATKNGAWELVNCITTKSIVVCKTEAREYHISVKYAAQELREHVIITV